MQSFLLLEDLLFPERGCPKLRLHLLIHKFPFSVHCYLVDLFEFAAIGNPTPILVLDGLSQTLLEVPFFLVLEVFLLLGGSQEVVAFDVLA